MSDYYEDFEDDYPVRPMRPSTLPLKIFLAIAVFSLLFYYADYILRGKWPNGYPGLFLCCCIVIMGCCIFSASMKSSIASWLLAFAFSILAVCVALGKIPVPKF